MPFSSWNPSFFSKSVEGGGGGGVGSRYEHMCPFYSSVIFILKYEFSKLSLMTDCRTFLRPPTSPRGGGKQTTIQSQVTMPTGTRSLDKRTLASLVLVKHLGEADRRNM